MEAQCAVLLYALYFDDMLKDLKKITLVNKDGKRKKLNYHEQQKF